MSRSNFAVADLLLPTCCVRYIATALIFMLQQRPQGSFLSAPLSRFVLSLTGSDEVQSERNS